MPAYKRSDRVLKTSSDSGAQTKHQKVFKWSIEPSFLPDSGQPRILRDGTRDLFESSKPILSVNPPLNVDCSIRLGEEEKKATQKMRSKGKKKEILSQGVLIIRDLS